jgi:hypothetical protein
LAKFALINNGVVENVIKADGLNASRIANKKGYDTEPKNVDWWPVQKGDTYSQNQFYRDGEPIKRIPTPDEKAVILGQTLTDKDIENIELGQYVTSLELRLIALEEA